VSDEKSRAGGRAYRMDKRAQDVAATRQDIVEAAVRLHGSVGPAATTVSAVAQEAGVTRLTVYRHFPDDTALFAACSAPVATSPSRAGRCTRCGTPARSRPA
jgi:AcrR family transcriptional regulator